MNSYHLGKLAAVTALAALPLCASAADNHYQFYIRLYPQVSEASYTNATAAGAAKATFAQNNTGVDLKSERLVSDSSSRWGFRGSTKINDTLKGVWQLENSLDINDRTGTVADRDSYVGLQGSGGTVIIGNHTTPYRTESGDKVGFLGVNAGNYVSYTSLLTKAGQLRSSNASFHVRARNAVAYWSPNFNGFSFRAQVSSRQETNSAATNRNIASFGAHYKKHGLYVGVGYEVHNDYFGGSKNAGFGSSLRGTSSKDTGARATIAYKFGAAKVGFVYEDLKYTDSGNSTVGAFDSYERSAWWLAGEYSFSKKLHGAAYIGKAEDGTCKLVGTSCTTDGLGASAYGIGARYDLTKDFRLFGFVAELHNDKSGTYTMLEPGGSIPPAGTTEQAVTFGIYYRFKTGS